ncbi:hypothetical protein KGF54_001922 [Candida jiufengensis]|uniref:uncharacterized protein n=1 Tax=Candida jiufengensis TaxID=497108 RepID=UPI002225086E|nr:uncharacterized protein KGF54_001922 [Candida jiufengensis]KAI5955361.1 hypothetical protein KGF54_001922 [Candida jiufengensis]
MATTVETAENPYATYPSVARTASINGFADNIYAQLPECAQPCMYQNTGITPCPYWDTGCLCVMPQFGGAIALCVAENCQGSDVGVVESLATSICSSAGVWDPYWFINDEASAALASAANVEAATTVATTEAVATTDAQEASTVEATQPVETSASEPVATTSAEVVEEEAQTSIAAEGEATTSAEEEVTAPETTDVAPVVEEGEVADEESVSATETATVDAEATSIVAELENGAILPGVAMGGVIAAIAALI